jgi:hypothetical protein
VRIALTAKLDIGGDLLATGRSFLRGDEANLTEPLDAYALVNLHAE